MPSFHQQMEEFVERVKPGQTIDQIAAACRAQVEIPADFAEQALDFKIKQTVRKFLNRAVSADGMPRLMSLPACDPVTGATIRCYKQVALFNRDDFCRAFAEADKRLARARRIVRGLEARYQRKFGKSLRQQMKLFDPPAA